MIAGDMMSIYSCYPLIFKRDSSTMKQAQPQELP